MFRIACLGAFALLMAAAPAPAAAAAAERFVTVGGSASSDCSDATPCTIERAVELANGATGDEVIVAPGDYPVGAGTLDATGDASGTLSIHGIRGLARPRIIGSGTSVLSVGRVLLSHLEISGTFNALRVGAGGTYDGLVATAGGTGIAIAVTDPANGVTAAARISNTVAHATGNGRAIDSSQANLDLRNVTAWTDGFQGSVFGVIVGGGTAAAVSPLTASLHNVIAHAGGGADDIGICTAGQSVTITVTNSDYADSGVACGAGTITDAGGQVTAAPTFVDAASGDFHQQAASATVNTGSGAVFEPNDLDLQARPFGAAPDIGADELATGDGEARAYTEHADGIASDAVTLHGAVNAGGGAAAYRFIYGTDAGLAGADQTPARAADGLATMAVTEQPAGILAKTTYYYRLEVEKEGITRAWPDTLVYHPVPDPGGHDARGDRTELDRSAPDRGRHAQW